MASTCVRCTHVNVPVHSDTHSLTRTHTHARTRTHVLKHSLIRTHAPHTHTPVAQLAKVHQYVGIDLVAMCVNDLIVQGAEPLFFLDYFATVHTHAHTWRVHTIDSRCTTHPHTRTRTRTHTHTVTHTCARAGAHTHTHPQGHLTVDLTATVVEGIAEGCRQSKCGLIGGETAEMPSMYAPGDYDLGGFSVGAVKKSDLLPSKDIAAGDVVLGIGSSGVHRCGAVRCGAVGVGWDGVVCHAHHPRVHAYAHVNTHTHTPTHDHATLVSPR